MLGLHGVSLLLDNSSCSLWFTLRFKRTNNLHMTKDWAPFVPMIASASSSQAGLSRIFVAHQQAETKQMEMNSPTMNTMNDLLYNSAFWTLARISAIRTSSVFLGRAIASLDSGR
jgi:hypothetical protein